MFHPQEEHQHQLLLIDRVVVVKVDHCVLTYVKLLNKKSDCCLASPIYNHILWVLKYREPAIKVAEGRKFSKKIYYKS